METTIKVYNMTCQSCVNKITKKLTKLKGVTSVNIDLETKEVKVSFNKNTNIETIKENITSLGYNLDKKPFLQALTYGIIPHIGCIAFVIAAIAGSTALMAFFKPLLMNRYAFYFLILISFVFAGISSIIYLAKNNQFNKQGIKANKTYLSIMFGVTIGVNLLLFFVIFPMTANITISDSISQTQLSGPKTLETITLDVDIPCSGHAPLISSELKTLNGIEEIKYSFPSKFKVTYNSNILSKEEMLALAVFISYPAVEIAN